LRAVKPPNDEPRIFLVNFPLDTRCGPANTRGASAHAAAQSVILVAILALAAGLFPAAEARAMYHPQTGRFLQRDPNHGGPALADVARPILGRPSRESAAQYADGMNLFQYAGGRPYYYVDPFGLKVYLVLTRGFGAPAWTGIRHCAIEIEFQDGHKETYEISGNPNLPGGGGVATDSAASAGSTGGSSAGSTTGGSAGSTTGGGASSGSAGSTTGGSSGSSAGSSSGSSSGGSSGSSSGSSSSSSNGGNGIAGPTYTPGGVSGELQRYTVDPCHANDDKYRASARSTPLGDYHIYRNNCCHWARKVIETSGGKWPIAGSINWGAN